MVGCSLVSLEHHQQICALKNDQHKMKMGQISSTRNWTAGFSLWFPFSWVPFWVPIFDPYGVLQSQANQPFDLWVSPPDWATELSENQVEKRACHPGTLAPPS